LRERPEDLPLLVDHFLDKAAQALDRPRPDSPADLIPLLRSHNFAGNVRELESMIFDALSRHRTGALGLDVFRDHIRREQAGGLAPVPAETPESIVFPSRLPTIKNATRMLIAEAIKRTGGNQTAAAAMLGISQQALSKRMRQKN
jgi:transcriptional regulator with PAS, ATPase and Fis domain